MSMNFMEGFKCLFFMITEDNKIYMCIHYNLMLVLVVNRSSY